MQTVTTNPNGDEPKPKEKPLTREQRRFIERREQEAKALHERLCQQFLTFFTECDNPEGLEVKEKQASISARWKVYCAHKRLSHEAYALLDTFCDGIIKAYNEAKEPVKTGETTT